MSGISLFPEPMLRQIIEELPWKGCSSMSLTCKKIHKLVWEVRAQMHFGTLTITSVLTKYSDLKVFPDDSKICKLLCRLCSKYFWFPEPTCKELEDEGQLEDSEVEILNLLKSVDGNLIENVKTETKIAAIKGDKAAQYLIGVTSVWGVDDVEEWYTGYEDLAKSALHGYKPALDLLNSLKANPDAKRYKRFVEILKEKVKENSLEAQYLLQYFDVESNKN